MEGPLGSVEYCMFLLSVNHSCHLLIGLWHLESKWLWKMTQWSFIRMESSFALLRCMATSLVFKVPPSVIPFLIQHSTPLLHLLISPSGIEDSLTSTTMTSS